MNSLTLIGRLTRDPELKYIRVGNENRALLRFSLAVARKFKQEGKPDADFFNCVVFGKAAETIEKWTGKGKRLLVQGRLEMDEYKGENGEPMKSSSVKVESFEIIDFMEKGKVDNQGGFNDFDFSLSDNDRIPF